MSKGTARAEMLPDLEIQPIDALIDAPVSIRLKGLIAEQKVTVRAQMADYLGCSWASQATLVADRDGCVKIANQNPSPVAMSNLIRWVCFGR
jgi:acyl-CoA thioester hydrolase/bile acid acetyltransferase-like protein